MKTIDEMSQELQKLEEQASNEEKSKKSMRQLSMSQDIPFLIGIIMFVVGIVGALLYRARISNSAKESICAVVAIVVAIWGGYRLRDLYAKEESRLRPRREAREAKMRRILIEIGKAKEGEENGQR